MTRSKTDDEIEPSYNRLIQQMMAHVDNAVAYALMMGLNRNDFTKIARMSFDHQQKWFDQTVAKRHAEISKKADND
jgi:hypothetical protein